MRLIGLNRESIRRRATAAFGPSDRPLVQMAKVPTKPFLDPKVAAIITSLEPPVIKAAREILLGAKEKANRGELIVLEPYQSAR